MTPTRGHLPNQQSGSFLKQTSPPRHASFRVLNKSSEAKGKATLWPFCSGCGSSALLWMLLASAHMGNVMQERLYGEQLVQYSTRNKQRLCRTPEGCSSEKHHPEAPPAFTQGDEQKKAHKCTVKFTSSVLTIRNQALLPTLAPAMTG